MVGASRSPSIYNIIRWVACSIYNILYWVGWTNCQPRDDPSIIFFMLSCKILCKNPFNLFFYTYKKYKKNNTWNIKRLVDDSFVPLSKRPSVLCCKLTDFKRWVIKDNEVRIVTLKDGLSKITKIKILTPIDGLSKITKSKYWQ